MSVVARLNCSTHDHGDHGRARRGVARRARLLAGMADRSGSTAEFSDALAGLRERCGGHDPGRVKADLAVLLADRGRSISDLAVLRDRPTLFGPVASTATAWRVLDKVEPVMLNRLPR